MPVETYWTTSRLVQLHALAAKGLSAREIAAIIGCSRSAVLGARHRRAHREAEPRRGGGRKRLAPTALPPVHPDDAKRQGVGLLELTDASCRWPLPEPGDGVTRRFCGDVVARESYCSEHFERAVVRIEVGDDELATEISEPAAAEPGKRNRRRRCSA